MKIMGTASHFKKMAAITAIAAKIIFGRLFFTEKSLNFKAIIGMVLTINQLNTMIKP